ncbi:MAG: VWA domain-containing protein [Gammaproteobacteria bacterium]|nr:VWA domain-containing protein [Gammaproteobacteria bacterium]
MKSIIIAIGLFALTAAAVAFYPTARDNVPQVVQQPPPISRVPPVEAPKIEVVFVLDTTGSMSELIQAAKDKIWSIASTMVSAQPAPEIKIGLVAYRDRGDAYVTKVVDLSDDLDSVYASLIDFEADGGGDGPESVNQALYDAVHEISWSQDPNSYQVVFLVGDAPPHMDYQDDVKYPVVLAEAARRGIVVNTIRCGTDSNTEAAWRSIAAATQGAFFSVAQSGGAIAMGTPYDTKIAELSAGLDATRLYYGNVTERAEKQLKILATDKFHAKASDATKARRAAFNLLSSGEKNQFGDGDLVGAVTSGVVKLDEIETEDLPISLQAMTPEERNEVVRANSAERDALKRQIRELSSLRADYLESEVAAIDDIDESLDYQIFETVRGQAEKKGLKYSASPKY